MLISDLRVMRGPNFWSVTEDKLIVVKLNLEDAGSADHSVTEEFLQKLFSLFPSLTTHSGLFENGTSIPHAFAHIAIELQKMAAMKCDFVCISPMRHKGVYNVAFAYQEEEAGLYAAKAAAKIIMSLLNNTGYDIGKDIEELEEIKRYEFLGLSTGSVVEEAVKRDIPWTKSHDDRLIILGYGARQKRIQATIASTTGYIGVDLAGDKDGTKLILKEAHLPIPEGITIDNQEEIVEAIKEVGFPLVTKPLDGNHGRGITLNITTFEQAIEGFKIAKEVSDTVIIERYITGFDYRLLVINYKFVAAVKREPAFITGNGKATVKELIDIVNSDPRREKRIGNILQKIEIDEITLNILKKRHLTLDSILPEGEILHVKETGNVSSGAIPKDVTDEIHPHNVLIAERVARLIGLDICGIDVMSPDMSVPLTQNGGAVIEVNAAPGIRMHIEPAEGKSRNVAGAIVDMMFPDGKPSCIPIVAVTGTNGKTTTTRLIAHMAHMAGLTAGYVTTQGIFINDFQLKYGDCSGPQSAKVILKDESVEFAVLECARGGILRSGLGFKNCDVGILLNVAEDHLGLKDIETLEDMARVKAVIPKTVKSDGYAVLNADDENVTPIAGSLKCNIAYFSLTDNNPIVKEHCNEGGIAAYISNGNFILYDGKKEISILDVVEVPLAHEGRAQFMIQNILPAIITAYVQNFGLNVIRKSLLVFESSSEINPGRLNFFQFKDFRVMLDYAHNPAGLEAISEFIRLQKAGRNVGIIAAPGDRRNEDIKKIGAIAARIFDHIIIRNDEDLRGRTAEDIQKLLIEGIRGEKEDIQIDIIPSEAEALNFAIKNAEKNSLICSFSESPSEAIKTLNTFLLQEQTEKQKLTVK